MAIDTSTFKSGKPTLYGGIRNKNAFWKDWAKKYSHTLSDDNKMRIESGGTPVVDTHWIRYFPEHKRFDGELLIHHHLDYGPFALPIPETAHARQPGWGIWHQEH